MINFDSYTASSLDSLKRFRDEVYQSFPRRADASLDLLDSMTAGVRAQSVIEHSLNPLFRRGYGSVHDAIHHLAHDAVELHTQQRLWTKIAVGRIPEPRQRSFYLLGIDTTGYPRQYASTLDDRTINYHPNPVLNNKPIQIGHAYSLLAALPEKDNPKVPPWIIPLTITRVPSDKKAIQIAVVQTNDLLKNEQLPFKGHLTVLTGDTAYGSPQFLNPMSANPDLVIIARVRGNRVFYKQSQVSEDYNEKGHPLWYGDPFRMGDSSTWGSPDKSDSIPFTFSNERNATVHIEAWDDILMRGKQNIPMHDLPFTLVRITIVDAEGTFVFQRPLWLIVMGKRRNEITLTEIYRAYRQRYDLEHFFRFGKQKLLLTAYQTPEVRYEENWCGLVAMAYAQLYCMAALTNRLPNKWERYLPEFKCPDVQGFASPSMTQRDALRILNEVGTPAQAPKQRGIAPGRPQGCLQVKRERVPVIMKGKTKRSTRSP